MHVLPECSPIAIAPSKSIYCLWDNYEVVDYVPTPFLVCIYNRPDSDIGFMVRKYVQHDFLISTFLHFGLYQFVLFPLIMSIHCAGYVIVYSGVTQSII